MVLPLNALRECLDARTARARMRSQGFHLATELLEAEAVPLSTKYAYPNLCFYTYPHHNRLQDLAGLRSDESHGAN